MSLRFERTDDVIRISQRRRGLRVTMYVIGALWILGALIMILLSRHETATRFACDHLRGTCVLERDSRSDELRIASITSVTFETSHATGAAAQKGSWVTLQATQMPRYARLCGVKGEDTQRLDAARAFAAAVSAFLADPRHAPIDLQCPAEDVNGPNLWFMFPISLVGWFVVLLLFARFSVETEVVLDRRANVIEVKGRGWLRWRWEVSRPLTDVTRIEVRKAYVGYGNYAREVWAVFSDGSAVHLWSPAATKLATFAERVAALESFIGNSDR